MRQNCPFIAVHCLVVVAGALLHKSNPVDLPWSVSEAPKLASKDELPNMDKGQGHWTYKDVDSWKDDYALCAGEHQSPIDIEFADIDGPRHSGRLAWNYQPLSGGKVQNNGHAIQVDGNFGSLMLPDGEYQAIQFHFHFPSEHSINGQLASGELHIVHQRVDAKDNDGLAVIGILLRDSNSLAIGYGEPSTLEFMYNLGFNATLPSAEKGTILVKSPIDLNDFSAVLNGAFYHYQGSLTTPPCSETVHWYIMRRPAAITKAMSLSFAKVLYTPSNRPVQDVNGRLIKDSRELIRGEFKL